MALTQQQIEEQKKEAEELLFEGDQKIGFAAGLFFGRFQSKLLFPYPQLTAEQQKTTDQAVARLKTFIEEKLDPDEIDRDADIAPWKIRGLADLGILGMTAPNEYGGHEFTQQMYCRIMETIGGACSSTAVFVNAHHSIGIRALLMYGTKAQQDRWLPDLVSGKKLGAFALTEPEAGSDAANVQTMARPTPDGSAYVINGQKQYITNGAIAQVLTLMARTPVEGSNETKVTAFIVTPDMPGFEVVEARMPKCGIRGTATARLRFRDMIVPKENVLGKVGRGLPIALNVLNFGRTTFGASCTGAAKACLEAATKYAKERVQFKQSLSEFELVQKKLVFMAAHAFAMEATTTQCAAFIDRGADDYKLETAMLKVWSTDALWKIVNDALQIFGGKGYFSHDPYERWMRDARINMIGEGANDVLRSFIAMVGIKPVADELLQVKESLTNHSYAHVLGFVGQQIRERFVAPSVPVQSEQLYREARMLGKRVKDFRQALMSMLMKYREAILFRQLVQEQLADVACELYASACTLSRLDHLLTQGNGHPRNVERDVKIGRYYLTHANRRMQQCLAALKDNDNDQLLDAANVILERD